MSGTENPPTTAPDDTAVGAVYYNTSTKFSWNWSIGLAAWVPVPKVYRALLTQSGTNAPVATVLENTLGGAAVTFSRTDAGLYALSHVSFVAGKVLLFAGRTNDWSDVYTPTVGGGTIVLGVTAGDDGYLSSTPIEILVYP